MSSNTLHVMFVSGRHDGGGGTSFRLKGWILLEEGTCGTKGSPGLGEPCCLKSRPHTLCCFDSSCKIRRALNGLTIGSPSHMAPGDKIHWPNKPPHHRNQHSPCSSLNRRLQFPASPQNYSNRPAASPEGARDRPHPPTLILQSLPPTVPGYSLSSWVQCPHDFMWHSGSSSQAVSIHD